MTPAETPLFVLHGVLSRSVAARARAATGRQFVGCGPVSRYRPCSPSNSTASTVVCAAVMQKGAAASEAHGAPGVSRVVAE
ncbi:hypothetical protein STVIR_1833 [Streptomyces viridochromogenes Tue57]|uniref:Uncharacterized protein n=1 Tax=Streptomyces viridochromogenes Tue57 TaxID=1160705 RepID=L8PMB1_STRVR|nr:hypothetical protein STVIR_1833 [Streptomyces viridochromogenes Tue57]